MYKQEFNVWDGASLFKQNVELKEPEFTIPPNTELCVELQFLDVCFHRVGSGLEKSDRSWLDAAQRTFPQKIIL